MVTTAGDLAEFSFYCPGASQVYLAGEFNGWRDRDLPMKRDGSGYWHASLRLEPGEFRFRYNADGQWFCDFAAFGVEFGPFGPDSVLRVGAGGGGTK